MDEASGAPRAPTPPERAPRWTRSGGVKRLGVVMIVRDEAPRLPALFADVAELADELVVVDTGSTDGTPELCRAWGATLVERPWRDDFSYARNQAIERAEAAYLLWLDGDDRVPAEAARALRALRDEGLPDARDLAFSLTVHNVGGDGRAMDSFRQVRVFPNRDGVRYRGAVHESFMDSLRAEGVAVRELPAELLHSGYASPEVLRAKAERNARMLRATLREDPTDLHARMHLARALSGMGEPSRAAGEMDAVVALAERVPGHASIRAELLVVRGEYRRAAGDAAGAAEDFLGAHRLRPLWGVPATRLAELRADAGEWAEVEALLGDPETLDFTPGAFGNPVVRLRATSHWLRGRSRLERGDARGAEASLRQALEEAPERGDARLDLGQALLDQGRFGAAREVLTPLGSDESVLPRIFEVLSALGLARAGVGEMEGAAECLAPMVEFLEELLPDPDGATPAQLAAALRSAGQATAARNLEALGALVGGA